MQIGLKQIAVLVAIFCAAVAWPAMADPFCDPLKAVAADAPNGFANFQGGLTKKEASNVEPPAMIDYYAVAGGQPDGAADCDIEIQEHATADGLHFPNYACRFPIRGKDKGAATRQLANRAAACLVGVSKPIGPGLDKEGGMLTMHAKDYSVSYSVISGPATDFIDFAIQSERK
jgi:hypothetical protein